MTSTGYGDIHADNTLEMGIKQSASSFAVIVFITIAFRSLITFICESTIIDPSVHQFLYHSVCQSDNQSTNQSIT